MKYILDTGFFIIIRDYYPDTFPSFWKHLDNAVTNEIISSVDEVKEELFRYGGKQQHLISWVNSNKNLFTYPTTQEQAKVKAILSNEHHQTLLTKKHTMSGHPVADPFVIAKAIVIQGTVVTRENPANRNTKGTIQGNYKIPDICNYYNVGCISPQEFMQQQNWHF